MPCQQLHVESGLRGSGGGSLQQYVAGVLEIIGRGAASASRWKHVGVKIMQDIKLACDGMIGVVYN